MTMARSNFVTDTEHMDRVAGNTIIAMASVYKRFIAQNFCILCYFVSVIIES